MGVASIYPYFFGTVFLPVLVHFLGDLSRKSEQWYGQPRVSDENRTRSVLTNTGSQPVAYPFGFKHHVGIKSIRLSTARQVPLGEVLSTSSIHP